MSSWLITILLSLSLAPPPLKGTDSRLAGVEVILSAPQLHFQRVKLAFATPEPACFYCLDDTLGRGLPWDELRRASYFTMALQAPQAEDALVASGFALARGVPSLYVVKGRNQLPWFLREAEQTYPGLVSVLVGEREQIWEEAGASSIASLHAQPLPVRTAPAKVDSFLGCLMSGLSEQQYLEGQTHLRRIDQVLQEVRGDRDNFCEGLNVASVSSFGTPHESLGADLEALRRSKNCVFYTYDRQPRPSSMWVELGAALAWNKPCLLLIPDPGALPPALRHGPLPPNLQVHEYGTHEHLLSELADPSVYAKLFL